MVVDDSKTIRRTAETLLAKEGCLVQTAVDGFEALAIQVWGTPEATVTTEQVRDHLERSVGAGLARKAIEEGEGTLVAETQFVVAGLLANRVLSAINAARIVIAGNKAAGGGELGIGATLLGGPAHAHGVAPAISRRF